MALYNSIGTISALSEVQSGKSPSGIVWQRMSVTLDLPGFQGSTTKQIFQVFGESVDDVRKFKPGEKVKITWSMYAKEWKGKWYNNVDLYKITRQEDTQSASAAQARPAPAQDLNTHEDDLPF